MFPLRIVNWYHEKVEAPSQVEYQSPFEACCPTAVAAVINISRPSSLSRAKIAHEQHGSSAALPPWEAEGGKDYGGRAGGRPRLLFRAFNHTLIGELGRTGHGRQGQDGHCSILCFSSAWGRCLVRFVLDPVSEQIVPKENTQNIYHKQMNK